MHARHRASEEILTECLQYMDSLELFDRIGYSPFLILDSHSSRYQPTFLDYTNDEDHKWYATIGIPYGTSIWQVGDSEEQNGTYKMSTYKEKSEIIKEKMRMGQQPKIENYEIIPRIVNPSWDGSFARVEYNKRAIGKRGWNPLNRGCLLHPEILATKVNDETDMGDDQRPLQNNVDLQQGKLTAADINLTEGKAGDVLDDLITLQARSEGRAQKSRERRELANNREAVLEHATKLTGGFLVKNGMYHLDKSVRDAINEKAEVRTKLSQKREKSKRKKAKKLNKNVAKVQEEKKHYKTWTCAQLKTMIRHKKRPEDPAVPTVKNKLQKRWRFMRRREQKERAERLAQDSSDDSSSFSDGGEISDSESSKSSSSVSSADGDAMDVPGDIPSYTNDILTGGEEAFAPFPHDYRRQLLRERNRSISTRTRNGNERVVQEKRLGVNSKMLRDLETLHGENHPQHIPHVHKFPECQAVPIAVCGPSPPRCVRRDIDTTPPSLPTHGLEKLLSKLTFGL